MKNLMMLVVLVVCGCQVAPGPVVKATRPAGAVEAAPGLFVTPFDQPCGDGNVVCADDQLCLNGDCIDLCGTQTCFNDLAAAWSGQNCLPASRAHLMQSRVR